MLAAVVGAEVDDLILQHLPAQLSEQQRLFERTRESAGAGDGRRRRRKVHDRRRVLVVSFIRAEEVEFVLDDRPANAQAWLYAAIRRVRCQAGTAESKRSLGHPLFWLIKTE